MCLLRHSFRRPVPPHIDRAFPKSRCAIARRGLYAEAISKSRVGDCFASLAVTVLKVKEKSIGNRFRRPPIDLIAGHSIHNDEHFAHTGGNGNLENLAFLDQTFK